MDKVPVIGGATHNIEDFSSFFCSELVAGALERGGVIKKISASEVAPVDLCMFNFYKKDYLQIKGKNKLLNGFNTTSPEGFGTYAGIP